MSSEERPVARSRRNTPVERPSMVEYTTVFPSGEMTAESAVPLDVNLVNFKSEKGAGPRL